MELRVYFKHMETSPALEAYAREKVGDKLSKFALRAADAQLTFAVEKGGHEARCHVSSHEWGTPDVHATDASSLYAAVDRLADRLDERLRRHKEQLTSHRAPRYAETSTARDDASETQDLIEETSWPV